jgi:hypothetical protein
VKARRITDGISIALQAVHDDTNRRRTDRDLCTALALLAGCQGGSEASKATDQAEAASPTEQTEVVSGPAAITQIHSAIPLYTGAEYREDLSRRDEVLIRNRYGNGAQVVTLATDDSYPQVYHYYTTYLAQFRAFPAQETVRRRSRTRACSVQLNQAMQDPFIPGKALDPNGKQVTLQIAETETEARTVIRYIVTDRPVVAAGAGGRGFAERASRACGTIESQSQMQSLKETRRGLLATLRL